MANAVHSSNMPPVKPQAPAGTETCDRYGNVIGHRPASPPEQPPAGPRAPTCDRWGHVRSTPAAASEGSAHVPLPCKDLNAGDDIDWK